jgi:hypothetical protein
MAITEVNPEPSENTREANHSKVTPRASIPTRHRAITNVWTARIWIEMGHACESAAKERTHEGDQVHPEPA